MTPAQWTPRLVQQRLREAFAVELRLPDSERPRGLTSVWPASPVHEFRDIVNWPDVRERVWQSWARAKGGIFPHEVSRTEEAQGWLVLLEGERRCLAFWALAAARGIPMRKVLRQRGGSRSTFYRRAEVRFAGPGEPQRKAHLIWINRRRSHPHTNIGRGLPSMLVADQGPAVCRCPPRAVGSWGSQHKQAGLEPWRKL